jgi:hypothetical protein
VSAYTHVVEHAESINSGSWELPSFNNRCGIFILGSVVIVFIKYQGLQQTLPLSYHYRLYEEQVGTRTSRTMRPKEYE